MKTYANKMMSTERLIRVLRMPSSMSAEDGDLEVAVKQFSDLAAEVKDLSPMPDADLHPKLAEELAGIRSKLDAIGEALSQLLSSKIAAEGEAA